MTGASPTGPGCQPTASAADASSQSGIPSAERMGEWLHGGDTGMSSKAIFYYMALGIKGGWTPSDTADLGRCVRLLDRFPEWAVRVKEMACVSNDWAALVAIWDDLVAEFRNDVANKHRDREWVSDKMLRALWYEKTSDGLWTRRKHNPPAQGTPTRSAETTGSVGEAYGGSVAESDEAGEDYPMPNRCPSCGAPPGLSCRTIQGQIPPCPARIAAAQGTSVRMGQDAQRLDPKGAGPVVEDHAPEPSPQTHTTKKKGE